MLQAKNINKTYRLGKTEVQVLSGSSLDVSEGEFVSIVGASGCGKSTLLHILGALDEPNKGTVHFRGGDVFAGSNRQRAHYRNRQIGFVFQFYHLLPELNVLENAMVPRLVMHPFWEWPRARRVARRDAEELLDKVGLGSRIRHRPNELSGGERQRVAVARALMNRPSLLLADEPTGNLDAATGVGILDLLTSLNGDGQSIVLVTHDSRVASKAHRCVTLVEGRIQEA